MAMLLLLIVAVGDHRVAGDVAGLEASSGEVVAILVPIVEVGATRHGLAEFAAQDLAMALGAGALAAGNALAGELIVGDVRCLRERLPHAVVDVAPVLIAHGERQVLPVPAVRTAGPWARRVP